MPKPKRRKQPEPRDLGPRECDKCDERAVYIFREGAADGPLRKLCQGCLNEEAEAAHKELRRKRTRRK